jgi:uncharacterized membrane protein
LENSLVSLLSLLILKNTVLVIKLLHFGRTNNVYVNDKILPFQFNNCLGGGRYIRRRALALLVPSVGAGSQWTPNT